MLKRYRNGIFYHIAISLAVIIFASPLFRILGFEYSSLVALASSMWCMLVASKRASTIETSKLRLLGIIATECGIYILIPLITSLLSAIFIPNCSLTDGLVFYIEIVPLTAIIAILLGAPIGLTTKSNRSRVVLVVGSWCLWLIVSLLPGYFGPQIFTYGWQYGYFPGFVWDEAMDLKNAYWWSRIIVVVVVAVCYFAIKHKRNLLSNILTLCLPIIQTAGLIFFSLAIGLEFHIIETTEHVERELSSQILIENTTIHFRPNSLTNDEIVFWHKQVQVYVDSIRSFYKLGLSAEKINIYLYPSVKELDEYVGTRSASISKPWRNELHIAKENLGSLKHELVHVMLAPYGKFPFNVSYSTGLTEGAAEAPEDSYDDIHSINYLASTIIDMKLAKGVASVMSFTGFASNASGKSYVLAGSFASYLIAQYGAEKYLQSYHTLDYESIYHKTIEQLEQEWLAHLSLERSRDQMSPMTLFDSQRTRFYFDRKSIVAEPCLRRIGKMMKQASQLFRDRDYVRAGTVYQTIIQESGRLDAVYGLVRSIMLQGKYREALYTLDTINPHDSTKQIWMHLLRGDLLFLSGVSIDQVLSEWLYAANLQFSGDYFLAAISRVHCVSSCSDRSVAERYIQGYYKVTPEKELFDLLKDVQSVIPGDMNFVAAKNFLLAQSLIRMGKLQQATDQLALIFQTGDINLYSDASLYYRLIRKKYDELRAAFPMVKSVGQ